MGGKVERSDGNEKLAEDTPKTSSTMRHELMAPSRQNNFIQAKKAKAMGL